jgi:hypothetical protein
LYAATNAAESVNGVTRLLLTALWQVVQTAFAPAVALGTVNTTLAVCVVAPVALTVRVTVKVPEVAELNVAVLALAPVGVMVPPVVVHA